VRRLLRMPLAWLIMGEVVLTMLLGAWAWHVFGSTQRQPAVGSEEPIWTQPAPSRTASPPAFPVRPAHVSPAARAVPGASLDGRPDLDRLNHEQAAWEAAEWRIVSTLIQAGKAYIDRVVMPAIARAERPQVPR
jgi:hypothetical protein